MSQIQGLSFVQDDSGFLWIGTHIGLNRFDGFRFEKFFGQEGFDDSTITDLDLDSLGRLWLTARSSISVRLPNGSFERIDMPEDLQACAWYRLHLVDDKAFAFGGCGIASIQLDAVVAGPLHEEIIPYQDYPAIFDIATVHDRAYGMSNDQVLQIDLRNPADLNQVVVHEVPAVSALVVDPRGNLTVGTSEGGLLTWDGRNWNAVALDTELQGGVRKLLIDRRSNLWIAADRGLYRLSSNGTTDYLTDRNGLQDGLINMLFEDDEGNVWVGENSGLTQMVPSQFDNLTSVGDQDLPPVWVVQRDENGILWMATDAGLYRSQGPEGQGFDRVIVSPDDPMLSIIELFPRDSEPAFAGAASKGLWIRDGETFRQDSLIKNESVLAFARYDGELWISTSSRVYRGQPDRWQLALPEDLFGDPRAMQGVRRFSVDEAGRLWMVFINHSVGFRDVDGSYTVLSPSDGYPFQSCVALAQRVEGSNWIGCRNGVYLLRNDLTVEHFGVNEGLPYPAVSTLSYDHLGRLWIGMFGGLCVMEGESQIDTCFTTADGLLYDGINSGAIFHDEARYMWLGTPLGTSRFDLANPLERDLPIRLHFERFHSERRSFEPVGMEVSLPSIDDSVTLSVNAIHFSLPHRVQIRSRLDDGQTSAWTEHDFGESPITLNYPNLTAGTYRIEVEVRSGNGQWQRPLEPVVFEIRRNWTESIWTYVLAGVMLAGLVYLVVRVRTSILLRQRQRLEELVEHKTHQLSVAAEELRHHTHSLEARQRVVDENLAYAQTIQSAMLPETRDFLRLFNGTFTVFRPKERVGGDFYWLYTYPDYSGFNAAVGLGDCTGHGVPGALLSMLSSSVLNLLMPRHLHAEPNELLMLYYEELRENLRSMTRLSSRPGLDLSICQIDSSSRTILFAGAMHSLVIQHGEDIELVRGDRLSLTPDPLRKFSFTLQKISYKEGSRLFMFSDGIEDQCGFLPAKPHKRWGRKRLIQFLKNHADYEIDEVGQILDEALDSALEKAEQRDDITLVGIEL